MENTKQKYYPNSGAEFEYSAMLPCPFCGSEPKIMFIGNDYTKSRKVTIKCTGVHCRVERTDGAINGTHEWCAKTCIDSWNTRVINPDKLRLDWIQSVMTPKDNYCEVFFAGLRRGGEDATLFQIESNPQNFETLNAETVRLAIDKAMLQLKPLPNMEDFESKLKKDF